MLRKLQGLYFEDYEIGDRFETPGRTISEADVVAYAGLSADYNPLHIDEEYANDTIYGSRIAHGMLVASIGFGAFMRLGTVIGTGMGILNVNARFLRPVHIGDTIKTEAEVVTVRQTSKPDRGIVGFKLIVVNQHGQTVCEIDYSHMIKTKAKVVV